MAQFSRTWWGVRFIEALEQFTDPGRLSRGRSYASGGKILDYTIAQGTVTARVRGSINPYFGVYKEPIYTTTIQMAQLTPRQWTSVIAHIASKANLVTQLLVNEMPATIDTTLAHLDIHLLPFKRTDFKTECSCPDFANPCKHIAGVYYLVAAELDRNPFLLFELRGLPKDTLLKELATSPLGRILATELAPKEVIPHAAESFFTMPRQHSVPQSTGTNLKEYWSGPRKLPASIEQAPAAVLPASVIKRQGDFPTFWPKDTSFIDAMEAVYDRVRTKNRDTM